MADNQRRATPGDMVRSIAVIMVPILLLTWLLTSEPKDYEPPVVPWRQVLDQARTEAGWPVLAPAGLPEEGQYAWRANRATWLRAGEPGIGGAPAPGNEWELGMLSPERVHFALTQSDGPSNDVISRSTREGKHDGDEQVAGRTWRRYETLDGRTRSLVNVDGKVTTVVSADTDFVALQQYASTLTDR